MSDLPAPTDLTHDRNEVSNLRFLDEGLLKEALADATLFEEEPTCGVEGWRVKGDEGKTVCCGGWGEPVCREEEVGESRRKSCRSLGIQLFHRHSRQTQRERERLSEGTPIIPDTPVSSETLRGGWRKQTLSAGKVKWS